MKNIIEPVTEVTSKGLLVRKNEGYHKLVPILGAFNIEETDKEELHIPEEYEKYLEKTYWLYDFENEIDRF